MIFFSFLIFTALGDQAFFHADRRSDRVKKWHIPEDKALPLWPSRRKHPRNPCSQHWRRLHTRFRRKRGPQTNWKYHPGKIWRYFFQNPPCYAWNSLITSLLVSFTWNCFFTLDSGRKEGPRWTGSTTQERSEGISFKILHAMHEILSLLHSLYLFLETVFYIRFRTKRGAQTNWKYHPRTLAQKQWWKNHLQKTIPNR